MILVVCFSFAKKTQHFLHNLICTRFHFFHEEALLKEPNSLSLKSYETVLVNEGNSLQRRNWEKKEKNF